jgi:hypothetical protein
MQVRRRRSAKLQNRRSMHHRRRSMIAQMKMPIQINALFSSFLCIRNSSEQQNFAILQKSHRLISRSVITVKEFIEDEC